MDARMTGGIQVYGRILDYTVGYLPDTHTDIIKFDHLNATVLEDSVAYCWKFMDAWDGKISVRGTSPQSEQLEMLTSGEDESIKVKYTLTEEELQNTVKFYQALMRKMLDEVYDARFKSLNVEVSRLEQNTWPAQHEEAKAYAADNTAPTPTLSLLATARGITLEEMVAKVLAAIEAYDLKVAQLLASKQVVESEIKALTTMDDCYILFHNRFNYHAPYGICEKHNITGAATLNL